MVRGNLRLARERGSRSRLASGTNILSLQFSAAPGSLQLCGDCGGPGPGRVVCLGPGTVRVVCRADGWTQWSEAGWLLVKLLVSGAALSVVEQLSSQTVDPPSSR